VDVMGDAISRALTAFSKAPSPAAGYATIASLLQEVGGGRRPASDDELKQAVRDVTQWIFYEHGEPIDEVLDRVIAEIAAALHFKGLYSDDESMRKAARPAVSTRMSPWAMGGFMVVIDPWEDKEQQKE
jgi:hypothetical protein